MKRKCYEFNDGCDGVVIAKSLNQAINILCKHGYEGMKHEIKKSLKTSDELLYSGWAVDWYSTKEKTGMKGWIE